MKSKVVLVVFLLLFAPSMVSAQGKSVPQNPEIDMSGYLEVAAEAATYRESRRLTEDEFIKLSSEPGTIVLDARSKDKYDELHIKGAINLSFPDIAVTTLNTVLPDKNARILIYCNNNVSGAPGPFPSKIAVASLNLSTYIALYSYGYRNVYELGPLVDMKSTKLAFESTAQETERRNKVNASTAADVKPVAREAEVVKAPR
jgi:hypothetical protein